MYEGRGHHLTSNNLEGASCRHVPMAELDAFEGLGMAMKLTYALHLQILGVYLEPLENFNFYLQAIY